MSKNRSKVHPNYKTQYRVANWPDYDKALVRRGDLTLWFTPEAIRSWTPESNGRRGGQRRYSDVAIETALTLCLLEPVHVEHRWSSEPIAALDAAPR